MSDRRVRQLVFAALPLLTVLAVPHRAAAQIDPDLVSIDLTQQPQWTGEVWPADFNRDGITDVTFLTTPAAGSALAWARGLGNGSFDAPQAIATGTGMPIGVGDVNVDGFTDIVTSSHIVPGRGDGTFTPPVSYASAPQVTPAQVVDMTGDGRADLVVLNSPSGSVRIYAGNGDFTFSAPSALVFPEVSEGMIAIDLNGDNIPDIANTSRNSSRGLQLHFNTGNATFTTVNIPLPSHGGGVSARDMNGDGITDLIVGMGTYSFSRLIWSSGQVAVFLGLGGGAFAAPLTYGTLRGPIRVVVGDFNGDGVPDVATGNQTRIDYLDPLDSACELLGQLWASVSVLLGRGDGTLGPAASFSMGTGLSFSDPQLLMRRLNTSDLNGDGRTDLLFTGGTGAIVLMKPPAENRPPVVTAGPDREFGGPGSFPVLGSATDPDHDWLTFEWRDEFGRVISAMPRGCINASNYSGTHEFTLIARDERNGVGSDTMLATSSSSGGPGPLPSGFTGENIGDVGAAPGTDSFTGASFVVSGGGADIWGTSDAFRFVHTSVSGDFEVVARVTSVQNIHPWTKAGLMIRQSLSPDSRHAFVFATPTAVNGVAFQRREFDGGTTIHTQGPFVGIDSWLRLVREGDVISAYSRVTESDPWELIGTQTLSGLTDPVHVGLAVTSHVRDTAATARFFNFGVIPVSGTLPAGWSSADVGSVALAGTAIVQAGSWRVQGSGADIWGTQDAFHYAYTRLPGDGILTARLASWSGPDDWTKAGVMIRESLDPAAAHHFLLASEGHVLAYQRRPEAGSTTLHTGLSTSVSPPVWLRIQRIGGSVRLFYARTFGTPASWTFVAESPFASGEVLIGFAVTSHADGQFGTGTFNNVSFSPGAAVPPSVALTAPADGTTLVLGGRVSVLATATDPDDGVREVHFEIESPTGWNLLATRPNQLGTDTIFAFQYQPTDVGPRRLRARAVDHGGLSSVSNVVNLHVVDNASAGWTSADVGAIGIAGSTAGLPPDAVTMAASGTDIWGTADAFRFTYFTMAFNGTLTARVAALDAPNAWTKAGVMLRQSTQADSPHAFMFVSRDNGLAFQRRTATSAATVHTGAAGGAAPQWVRLRRSGDLVTASFSADGVQWTDVGSEVLPLGTGPVLAGLALTSHDNASLATAMFDSIVVSP